jgi:hypothetical protein
MIVLNKLINSGIHPKYRWKLKFLVLIVFLLCLTGVKAQFQIKVQCSAGYSEHFSTGISFEIKHHALFFDYGSNLFINTDRFSSKLAGYKYKFNPVFKGTVCPLVGLKAGYAVYTDLYYQWELAELIPFIGAQYNMNQRVQLFGETGLLVSHELSQERIGYGDIGNYRTYLPEFRLGINFKLW